jgi:WhiB family transcriptional regulator, redox-sensing transcriptional regulator
MAPMQWAGTTAVLEAAPPEDDSARNVTNGVPNTVAGGLDSPPASGSDAMVGAPGGLELPCRDDPELFFAESPGDVEFAKSLCRGCAARIACLTGAIERREPWGVWGGELFLRGEVVPYKRPRGRPRKATVAA